MTSSTVSVGMMRWRVAAAMTNFMEATGDDFLAGMQGDDLLDGGSGFDRVGYGVAPGGVTVNLKIQGTSQDTVNAGLDTLVNIEAVSGSPYSDTLIGNSDDNWLWLADSPPRGESSDLVGKHI